LVFVVLNAAALAPRRPPKRSHFVPTSTLRACSGSSSTVLVLRLSPSVLGFNDVPTPA
jgi:hypothetical protein